jgi:hypothetical protein
MVLRSEKLAANTGLANGLVEYEDIRSATDLISIAQTSPILVGGKPARVQFAKQQSLGEGGRTRTPSSGGPMGSSNPYSQQRGNEYSDIGQSSGSFPPSTAPSSFTSSSSSSSPVGRVVLILIKNPWNPINVSLIHRIVTPHGEVLRIVLFQKPGNLDVVQALVEFATAQQAHAVRESLNNKQIYDDCCFLTVTMARNDIIQIKENSNRSWDYTNPNLRRCEVAPLGGPPDDRASSGAHHAPPPLPPLAGISDHSSYPPSRGDLLDAHAPFNEFDAPSALSHGSIALERGGGRFGERERLDAALGGARSEFEDRHFAPPPLSRGAVGASSTLGNRGALSDWPLTDRDHYTSHSSSTSLVGGYSRSGAGGGSSTVGLGEDRFARERALDIRDRERELLHLQLERERERALATERDRLIESERILERERLYERERALQLDKERFERYSMSSLHRPGEEGRGLSSLSVRSSYLSDVHPPSRSLGGPNSRDQYSSSVSHGQYSSSGPGRETQYGSAAPVGGIRESYGNPPSHWNDRGTEQKDRLSLSSSHVSQPFGTPVLYVSNLPRKMVGPNEIFNLFCPFGRILRVKEPEVKEGETVHFLIQFAESRQAFDAMGCLNKAPCFGGALVIEASLKTTLKDDESKGVVTEFEFSPLQRFGPNRGPTSRQIFRPSSSLYFGNFPEGAPESVVYDALRATGCESLPKPGMDVLPSDSRGTGGVWRSGSSNKRSGFFHFNTVSEAVECLIIANHANIDGVQLRLSFSNALRVKESKARSRSRERTSTTVTSREEGTAPDTSTSHTITSSTDQITNGEQGEQGSFNTENRVEGEVGEESSTAINDVNM